MIWLNGRIFLFCENTKVCTVDWKEEAKAKRSLLDVHYTFLACEEIASVDKRINFIPWLRRECFRFDLMFRDQEKNRRYLSCIRNLAIENERFLGSFFRSCLGDRSSGTWRHYSRFFCVIRLSFTKSSMREVRKNCHDLLRTRESILPNDLLSNDSENKFHKSSVIQFKCTLHNLLWPKNIIAVIKANTCHSSKKRFRKREATKSSSCVTVTIQPKHALSNWRISRWFSDDRRTG